MCDPVTATFVGIGVSAATSVGMGVYNGYAQAGQAQASLNMAAQQQQAQISIQNQQAQQQANFQQAQLQQQQSQFQQQQALQLQQQRLQQQQNLEQQLQSQQLQIAQQQQASQIAQEQAAIARNLQMSQANAEISNRFRNQTAAVNNERTQLLKRFETDRKVYQDNRLRAELQKDENLSAANRVYISEQQKLEEKRKEAAFKAQAIMARSIGAKGAVLATGRTGQSIGLLVNDAERQKGFALAQERAMIDSAQTAAIINMDQAFGQNQAADRRADASVGFNPELPYLPSLPEVPDFVSLGIPSYN